MGVHTLDQNTAENVAPVVIVGYGDPHFFGLRRERGAIAFSVADRRQKIRR